MFLPDWNDWVEMIVDNWVKTGRSETQLAKDIGINQATLNSWKNNTRGKPRDPKIVAALIEYFKDSNPEIYKLLGVPVPADPYSVLEGLPIDFIEATIAAHSEYKDTIVAKGISEDSPEAVRISKELLAKHGIHFTDTE